jgi:two-component system sensor histidine kinase KdpD
MAEKKHFLVAISSSPNSEYLIRWTYELVVPLDARWTVLHVDTPADLRSVGREVLRKNLELARRLGAEIATMSSEDVAATIVNYARIKGVTQIIIGKSDPHGAFRFLSYPLLTQRIIRMSGAIDVLVLQEKDFALRKGRKSVSFWKKSRYFGPLLGAGIIFLVTFFNALVLPLLGYHGVSILFLLAITGLAFFLDRWSVLLSTVLAALSWNFLFIPPLNTFTIGAVEDILMFLMFFVTAFTTGFLATRVRTNEKMLALREERMSFLYNYVQSLSEKKTIEDMVLSSLTSIEHQFDGQCILILGNETDGLSGTIRCTQEFNLPGEEREPAEWCFKNNRVCGRYAPSYESAMFHYLPLATPDSVMGVFGIRLSYEKIWSQEQESLLFTLLQNLSLSLEREQLAQANQKSLITAESERLGKILLNLISHELRTPLTTIKGAVTALMEPATVEDPQSRGGLLDEMLQASEKLNNIVENLLSMSRLESRNLKLRREQVILEDMVGVVLDSMTKDLVNHPVEVTVQGDAAQLNLDFVLFIQVLTNLLQNVVRHTPPGTRIWLMALVQGRDLRLRVCDAGPGVPLDELPLIFEKFYRGGKTKMNSEGFGLGLSICKGIIEAHGGTIQAAPRPGGGLCIEISVPDCIEPCRGELE